jgi:hypothetical protein
MAAKDIYDNKDSVKYILVTLKGLPGCVVRNGAGICLQLPGKTEIVLRTDNKILHDIFLDQPGEPKTLYTLLMGDPADVVLANSDMSDEPAASSPASIGEEEITAMKAEIVAMKAEIVAMKAAIAAFQVELAAMKATLGL